ncbi:hypothetical protein PWG14_27765 [Chromobacterium amazonense]|uniref:hypothetical protein n=1 Tax=Chromobacterium amazonense TaxID=1382803 RepID=UPI00237D4A64|nr:hypothetical protein [Chromobacterium amazonense]MDE1716268.1 hypothetical protein [Chromobacterium amazonense]
MHSISPYTIRCFDPENKKNKLPDYCKLEDIRGNDLYLILKSFLEGASDGRIKRIEEEKRSYYFSGLVCDDERRELSCCMMSGFYGVGTDIVNIESGETVFKKGVKNSDMIQYYVHFFIPRGCNEAICIMSTFRGDGIKTVFLSEFSEFFRGRVPLALSMNPLSYDKALVEWQDAVAKEIKVVKFNAVKALEDVEVNGGHFEPTLVMKPERRRNFGPFKNFFQPETEQAKLVEILTPMGEQIKTVVQLGDRKRVFRVGQVNDNVVCQIDVPPEVEQVDGMPKLDSIRKWSSGIIAEFCKNLYPGVRIYYECKD